MRSDARHFSRLVLVASCLPCIAQSQPDRALFPGSSYPRQRGSQKRPSKLFSARSLRPPIRPLHQSPRFHSSKRQKAWVALYLRRYANFLLLFRLTNICEIMRMSIHKSVNSCSCPVRTLKLFSINFCPLICITCTAYTPRNIATKVKKTLYCILTEQCKFYGKCIEYKIA